MNVDVVIVNYHSWRVLRTSLRAAQRFLGDRARFILVDNSPGDGSQEVIASIATGSTVIENAQNVGFAAAVNQGIRAGVGEVVLLLNPDIDAISGEFSHIEDAFRDDPRLAAVTVQLRDPDGSIQRHVRGRPTLLDLIATAPGVFHRLKRWKRLRRFTLSEWDHQSRREVNIACGACLWLRRSALEDVGDFDERFFVYWEETDWLVRATARDWKIVFLPSIEVIHASRTSTDAGPDAMSFLFLESQHKYVRKHFGLAGSVVFRASLIVFDSIRWLRSVPGTKYARRRGDLRRRLLIHLGGST